MDAKLLKIAEVISEAVSRLNPDDTDIFGKMEGELEEIAKEIKDDYPEASESIGSIGATIDVLTMPECREAIMNFEDDLRDGNYTQ